MIELEIEKIWSIKNFNLVKQDSFEKLPILIFARKSW